MLHDYVYYLKVDGEVIYELVFESEKTAIEFAEASEYQDYEVIEWDCE